MVGAGHYDGADPSVTRDSLSKSTQYANVKRFRTGFQNECGRVIDLATPTFAGNALAIPLVTMARADFGYKLRMVAEGWKRKLLNEQNIFN